jgi:hypothetical protein
LPCVQGNSFQVDSGLDQDEVLQLGKQPAQRTRCLQGTEARWRREQRSVAARAGAWAASVTAYVFDPVTSWLGTWTR